MGLGLLGAAQRCIRAQVLRSVGCRWQIAAATVVVDGISGTICDFVNSDSHESQNLHLSSRAIARLMCLPAGGCCRPHGVVPAPRRDG